MKKIAVKIEDSKKPYRWCYSNSEADEVMRKFWNTHKKALEIKIGNKHYYVDEEGDIDWVMYYVKSYLNIFY